jgi:hypothetical protein
MDFGIGHRIIGSGQTDPLEDLIMTEFRMNFENKPTEELLDIWQKNDRTAYREEALEAIRQILVDRKCEVPPQNQFVVPIIEHATFQNVALTDINIPFWDMVWFMLKWSVASIPAALIVGFFTFHLWPLVNGLARWLGW